MVPRRTQAQRTADTRRALVDAARLQFSERGYAAVGTDDLARAAGVTRGALYHQFGGKEELFAAVFEQVESEIADRIGARLATATDLVSMVHIGIAGWLEACAEPAVHQVVLIDAPAALGWERWREVGRRFGVGLVDGALQELAEAGLLSPGPTLPLAHLLAGALEEGALYAARSQDPDAARAIGDWMVRLVEGLLTEQPAEQPAERPAEGR